MLRRMLYSKIHRATVTEAVLDYPGSLTLDLHLMRAARLLEYQEVQVVNVNNGSRFTTYVIRGEPGSGAVHLNGAAARLGSPGDLVIIMAFASFDEQDAEAWHPVVVHVDGANQPIESGEAPS